MSIYKMRTEFSHYLKFILILIAAVFIIGAVFQFSGAPKRNPNQVTGTTAEVIAKVNGEEISGADFDALWINTKERARQGGVRSPLVYAEIRGAILNQLIQSKQLIQTAQRMGVDLSDKRVNAEVDKVVTEQLKLNREATLGKLSTEQEKTDPREDREYMSELKNSGLSINMMIENIKTSISVDQVKAQLASEGIRKKITDDAKSVSDKDIEESYKEYNVQMLFLSKTTPAEQLKTKADKIVQEAKKGSDFTALIKANSTMKDAEKPTKLSSMSSFGPMKKVVEAARKLKPNQVSNPINTEYGTFIVKLLSTSSTMPAKLDAKAKESRKKEITSMKEQEANMALQADMQKNKKIEVIDPELEGYYYISEATQNQFNKQEYDKNMTYAMASLNRALKKSKNKDIVGAKLAQIQIQMGRDKEAKELLVKLMDSPTASVSSPDLRIMLGDLYKKSGDKDNALKQYQEASDIARNDSKVHEDLIKAFNSVGRADLAATEKAWVDNYNKKMKAQKELQK